MKLELNLCPCCSGQLFKSCCAPYLKYKQFPQTPEALMRSRYTAYTLADIDYVVRTMRGPAAAKGLNRNNTYQFAKNAIWQGLEVIRAPVVDENSDQGIVEFVARYQLEGRDEMIHEISEFHRENGRWYYVDSRQS